MNWLREDVQEARSARKFQNEVTHPAASSEDFIFNYIN